MKLLQTKSFSIAINEYGNVDATIVCILLPGRLDTKDYINFVRHGQLLAELGYYVISVDPPGTWNSPGDIDNYSTSMYIQAVYELIEKLGNRQTILLGHSRGGATAMLASKNPHVSAVILINAAYGAPSAPNNDKMIDGYQVASRDLPPGDKRTEDQKTFKLPLSYFEDGKKHNPTKALREFSGPKLLIHADKDEFTVLSEVEEIFSTITEPKMLIELNCMHDYRLSPEAIDTANIAIKEFLRKYISN